MRAERVAAGHYADRRARVRRITQLARRTWRRVDPGDLDRSWLSLLPEMLVGVTGGQLAAARAADTYLDTVLAAQGLPATAQARLVPDLLAGVASDGRALDSLLQQPVITVKVGLAGGADLNRSLAAGFATLEMIARTQVADAGRVADQVAMVARPAAGGYVRMLVGDSCARCVVLAGRRYAWNAGFRRHPRC